MRGNRHLVSIREDVHLMSLREDQSRAGKVIDGSHDLPYIVRQLKPSPIKVDRENLRVCWLKSDKPVGKIFLLEGYSR